MTSSPPRNADYFGESFSRHVNPGHVQLIRNAIVAADRRVRAEYRSRGLSAGRLEGKARHSFPSQRNMLIDKNLVALNGAFSDVSVKMTPYDFAEHPHVKILIGNSVLLTISATRQRSTLPEPSKHRIRYSQINPGPDHAQRAIHGMERYGVFDKSLEALDMENPAIGAYGIITYQSSLNTPLINPQILFPLRGCLTASSFEVDIEEYLQNQITPDLADGSSDNDDNPLQLRREPKKDIEQDDNSEGLDSGEQQNA